MQQLCLYVEITHDFSNIFYATVVKGGINVFIKVMEYIRGSRAPGVRCGT